ncbi:FliH/SctL family protein [Sandarakinorhabdus sp. AAP62]|uniref:FliH/SctL family protein n=1 Tax=Sandarakinorhabdus sp. AAP62 TaxID=1248916 RepID=UPI0003097780|nr:FliH/SctL family protein [Sandarakinorhabdus sp. AAP62]
MTAHDPRLAALLAGVSPEMREGAPGLARLLSSLMPTQAPPPRTEMDVAVLLAEARTEGRAQGLADGEAAGRAAADAELAPLRAALANAAAAARAATAIDEAALRPMLVTLVEAVARTVLMAELTGGRRVLAPLVEAALAEVGEGALPTLMANPETLALLGPELPPGLATAPDATLPPAHVVLAAPDYRIEAGIEERLARIVKALA